MVSLAFVTCAITSVGSAVPPLRRVAGRAMDKATVVAADEAVQMAPKPTYDWLRNWYPVNVLDTMDQNCDHRFQLLGLNLIAGYDADRSSWIVADDLAPPRSKPLTRWEKLPLFEPHAAPVGPGTGDCYPVTEADGLLWVFPYSGPDAEEVAAAATRPHSPPVSLR